MTIRGVSDAARRELAARAARRGQSMQEFVRILLEAEAAAPDLNEVIERVAARKRTTSAPLPAHRILAAREDERR